MNDGRDANPYAPPQGALVLEAGPVSPGDEALRRQHLKHEASIRGIGALWLLGGLLTLPAAGLLWAQYLAKAAATSDAADVPTWISLALYPVLGGVSLVAGLDLRRIRPRARFTGGVVAALSLLSFPMGTVLGAYALWLLHSEAGKIVCTERYAGIRAATPHIVYRTPRRVWILLGLVALLGVLVAVAAALRIGS